MGPPVVGLGAQPPSTRLRVGGLPYKDLRHAAGPAYDAVVRDGSMNQLSGAEAVVRMLKLHGVEHVFGLCGDTSLPFYDALYRLGSGITHILTRDERSAAYMADGYARVSGRPGVCEGPSGGGATYILPGVVEANESSVPLLAITTDIAVASRGRFTLTELDQEALFRPLTKFNRVVDAGAALPGTIRQAFLQMTTGRPGAVHIGLPFDVQQAPVDEADVWADPGLGRYPAHRTAPAVDDVEQAARAIANAERPLFICGGGVVISGAEPALLRLAERLGAPVATSISGKGSIAEHHPLALGVVGSNGGTPETRSVVEAADLAIFVGCRAGSVTTERWRLPARTCRTVHIDIDSRAVGVNYEAEAALIADARASLDMLHDALADWPGKIGGEWGAVAVSGPKAQKFRSFEELARSDERPIRPERVVAALQTALPDDAVLVADPGTPCPYLSAYYQQRKTGRYVFSNRAHGALGYSLPAAIGASYGRPGAKCVAVMGDGAFGFAVGELETAVRLRVPVTFVVLSNAGYGWIKAGQKTRFQAHYFSVDFSRGDHARIARAYGLKAWRVEDPRELASALAAAVAADGPTLVDIVTQPLHEARAPVSEWIA